MNFRTRKLTAIAAGLIAAMATAAAGLPQLCSTAPNDAAMTVGPSAQGYYFDHVNSNGTGYTFDCTPYYKVDITVPGTYKAPLVGSAITMAGGFDESWTHLTEANCKDASLSILIYKRTVLFGSSSAWKLVNMQNIKEGTWVPFVDSGLGPYCALGVPLRVVASGSDFGYDQYRFMALPKLFGAAMPAVVGWEWSY